MSLPSPIELSPESIRDRIVKIEKAKLGDFLPHPFNPKLHPDDQARLVSRLMTDIGWVGVALAYKSKRKRSKKWTLIDAHLRQALSPNYKAWVAFTDLTDDEADLMVALYDESSRGAQINPDAFNALQAGLNLDNFTGSDDFRAAFERMATRGKTGEPVEPKVPPQKDPDLSEVYIEVFCSRNFLTSVEETLNEWSLSEDVTINIS